MKTKLLAIVLSILCLVQPVMAVGMVGMESAEEISSVVETADEEIYEEAELAGDYSAASAIILKEDFEGYTEGQALAGSAFSYVRSGFNAASFGNLPSSTFTATGTTFGGRKVVKVSGTSDNYNMAEIRLPNLPLWGAGEYILSIDYYLDAVENGSWSNFGSWHANGYFAQTSAADVKKVGQWNTVSIKYVVTESGSSFSILPYNPTGAAGTAITNTAIPGFTPGYTTSAKNLNFTYYIDNVTWKKVVPATVTYVDAAGETLGTINANNGDEIAVGAGLDVNYVAVYTVDGETYKKDETLLVTGDVTVTVTKYVPENIPSGAIAYEDFEGFGETAYNATAVQFVQPYSYTADGYSATIKSYSTMINKYKNFNGDMVLVEKPTGDYRLGLGIHGVVLPDGEYVYTVNLFPVTAAPSSYTMRFTCGTNVDVNLSQISATITAGQWNTLQYPFTIYTEDGVRKINICNGVGDHEFNGTFNVTNFATHKNATWSEEYYFDDISLTAIVPATVTYVDEQGATIKTVNTSVGETVNVLDKAGLGINYYPVYKIDGVEVKAGAAINVTGNITVNVSKYVPENMPEGTLLYEDFEVYTEKNLSASNNNTAFIYNNSAFAEATFGNNYSPTTAYAMFGGDMAWKQTLGNGYVAGTIARGLNITENGKYRFTADLYIDSPVSTGNITLTTAVHVNGSIQSTLYLNKSFNTTDLRQNWIDYEIDLEVYEENDKKYAKVTYFGNTAKLEIGSNAITAFGHFGNTSAAGIVAYYDNVCVSKVPSATVTYVDENGDIIKSVTANVGDTVKVLDRAGLGIDYYPVYKIDGVKVEAGYAIALTGDVTVVVEKYAPVGMPENAVLFEDFELVDDGVKTSDAPGFTINDGGLSTYFSNGDVGAGTITTVDGNKVMLVSASLGKWNNIGIRFNNLPVTKVGTYTLTFKANRLQSELFPEVDPQWQGYHMNFGSGNYNNFTSFNDEEWITYTETFKVYDNAGVKSIKWIRADGSSGNLTYSESGLTDHFYMVAKGAGEAGTADGKISTGTTMSWYLDDVCLTYDEPAVFNASFVDGNGDSFAFTDTGANDVYTLPTAAQLGVDYTPCYAYNGVTYYPGQTVAYSEDTDAEFVVSKTDVIYSADFDREVVKSGDEDHKLTVAGGVGYYDISTVNGGKWNSYKATGFNFDKPGKYTIFVDLKLDPKESGATSFATYFYMYGATSDDGQSSVKNANWSAGVWNSIVVEFDIYEKDGALYYKNVNGAEVLLENGNITNIGFGGNVNATAASTARMYFDNFTVKFTPYAPTLVNKASYRVKDENGKAGPAGIRFASYVTDVQYDACTEYGFVVTRKTLLGGDYAKLNLKGVTVTANGVTASANADGVLVVAAAAYDGKVTRTYTHDGATFGTEYMGIEETFFTGILTGIPSGMEAEVFVGRPYIVIDGNIYYGDCIERCYNDFFAAQNS